MNRPTYFLREFRDRSGLTRNRRRLRALALALTAGLVTTQVFPTLAENSEELEQISEDTATVLSPIGNSDPSPEEAIEDGATNEAGSDEGVGESNAGEAVNEGESSDEEPELAPPPPPPPFAISDQNIFINMPSSVRVDPRASTVFLPRMLFYSTGTLMVCISSNALRFDIGTPGMIDDGVSEYVMISGDQSSYLVISGNSAWVTGYLNSEMGMKMFSDIGGVGKKSVFFRFVSISQPSLNDALCLDGSTSNYRAIQVVPLGLSQNISKGSIPLQKKGK